jgi:excisionase family DNA binding protein
MSALASALLAELTPDDLARLAQRLAPYLRPVEPATDDGWLTTKGAADYLGLSVNALHKLTAARQVPFTQASEGARCYFRRSDLDDWRQS